MTVPLFSNKLSDVTRAVRLSCAIICVAYCSLSVEGQWSGLVFHHIGKSEGLSSQKVNKILQDDLGYMWFATADGLNRFDGHTMRTFHHDPADVHSFQAGDVLSMTTDANGDIWTGTRDGWLSQYRLRTGRFYNYELPKDSQLLYASVWDISTEGDSLVWLATEGGLVCFHRATQQFKTWQPQQLHQNLQHNWFNIIYGIHQDPHDFNLIWLSTRRGLLRFYKESEEIKICPFEGAGSAFYAARRFRFEGDSTVWLAAERGSVIRFNKYNWRWRQFRPKYSTPISSYFLLPASAEKFYTGLSDHGLALFDKQTGRFKFLKDAPFTADEFPKGDALAVCSDRSHRLWIGTDKGVFWTWPERYIFKHYRVPPPSGIASNKHFIADILEDPDGQHYWAMARYGKGIYKIDKVHNTVVATISNPQLPGLKPMDLLTTKLIRSSWGKVYIGTDQGLFEVDFSNHRLKKSNIFNKSKFKNSRFIKLENHPDGHLYCLTANPRAMIIISPPGKQYEAFTGAAPNQSGATPIHSFTDLAFSREGAVWLFGDPAIIHFDRNTKIFSPIPCNEEKGCPPKFWASAGVVDAKGCIWTSYEAAGLNRYDPHQPQGRQFSHFRTGQGLPGNKVYTMDSDAEKYIWLSTNNGLSRLDFEQLDFLNFDKSQGLVRDDLGHRWVAGLKVLAGGEVFIGGHNFFTIFQPGALPPQTAPSTVVFNEFYVYDKKYNTDTSLNFVKKITLEPDQNFFSLAFAGLNYDWPEAVQYRYRLAGYETQWRESSSGRASYTNVPPGDYVFEVSANLPRSGDATAFRSLNIEVLPPLYATWWFRSIAGGILVLTIFGIYKWRIGQIRKQEAIKAAYDKKVADVEVKALRAQMNPHFLFNSLNSIKNYIVQNEPRIAARYLTKFSQLMRLILNNSRSTRITLAEEIKALKLYVELENLRFDQQFEYLFDIEPGLPLDTISIPPLILQPYVENAIWHGLMHKAQKGHLWIRIYKTGQLLHIEIEDDGVGRNRARSLRSKTVTKRKSMGMDITRDRLSRLDTNALVPSKVEVKDLYNPDAQPTGTLVHIKIPVYEK